MESYNYYRVFGCFSRKFKIRESEPPPDVTAEFRLYADGADHMMADQLLKFLVEYQREEGCSAADAEAIVQNVLHRRHRVSRRRGLSLEDFFYFLFQDDLNGPINSKVHHDMSAPLQHYFIYTGHNSYLTGNQLSSDCSEIPIIRALENGVRGIELDLWPNSSKDNVHVLHGRTLTPPIPLIKCLKSIREHAFVKSPYPVIITLEDHLTPALQAKVAEMVVEVFGDILYYPESDCVEDLPSPEALKYKIILSTKPPKDHLGSNNKNDAGETQDKDSSEDEQLPRETSGPLVEDEQLLRETSGPLVEDEQFLKEASRPLAELEDVDKSGSSDQEEGENDAFQQKSGNLAAPEYTRLITIRAGKAKNGLRDALRSGIDKVNRISLNEQRFQKAAALYPKELVRFTQKNILRVFPKGTRVTSSNYRPIIGWMHGAQMVALNMQGYGKSLWMMHGLFRSNGGCGYVKKPDLLMKRGPDDEAFDPKSTLPVKTTLKVTVYMGDGWRLDFSHTHFDTYSPPDFYTKVQIVGVPADAAKRKTRIIEDDWTPYWDEEFRFALTVPELALIRIEVKEHNISGKDDFGGQTCLAVSELRQGIRAVPLYDKKGRQFKSVKLLVKFQFE